MVEVLVEVMVVVMEVIMMVVMVMMVMFMVKIVTMKTIFQNPEFSREATSLLPLPCLVDGAWEARRERGLTRPDRTVIS